MGEILRVDGVLRIAVPDFEKVVKICLENKDLVKLFGFLSRWTKRRL